MYKFNTSVYKTNMSLKEVSWKYNQRSIFVFLVWCMHWFLKPFRRSFFSVKNNNWVIKNNQLSHLWSLCIRESALMLTLLIKMCIAFLKKVGNIIKLSSLKYELKHEMLSLWNRVNVYGDRFLISEWCMSTYVNKKGMSLDRLSKFDIIVFSLDIMCQNT